MGGIAEWCPWGFSSLDGPELGSLPFLERFDCCWAFPFPTTGSRLITSRHSFPSAVVLVQNESSVLDMETYRCFSGFVGYLVADRLDPNNEEKRAESSIPLSVEKVHQIIVAVPHSRTQGPLDSTPPLLQ